MMQGALKPKQTHEDINGLSNNGDLSKKKTKKEK